MMLLITFSLVIPLLIPFHSNLKKNVKEIGYIFFLLMRQILPLNFYGNLFHTIIIN